MTSYTIPVKLLPKVSGAVNLRICDEKGLMSQTSFNLNINSGEKVTCNVAHNPSAV